MDFGYNESSSLNLKEGINVLTPVEMFKFEEGQYGPQIYFEFGVKGSDMAIKHWVNPPSKTDSSGQEIDYYDALVDQFNITMSQFLTGFFSPDEKEEIANAINEAGKKAMASSDSPQKQLEAFANALRNLLPEDWNKRECQVLLHYPKGSEYLRIPKNPKLNGGRLFNAHKDRTLEITDYFQKNRMNMNADTNNFDDTASNEAAKVNW